MTDLEVRIKADMVSAMKAKDSIRVSTLRLVRAALKNAQIDLGKDLEEVDIIRVLNKLSKQRADSIAQYESAGRQDLAEKEKQEMAILKEFLPEMLSENEIQGIIDLVIDEVGAQSMKDMGKVMKAVTSRVAGRADGRMVSDLVKKKLG